MENLKSIEAEKITVIKEREPYNPVFIAERVARIRQQEFLSEPWKKDPQILDAWLDKELASIPNGQ